MRSSSSSNQVSTLSRAKYLIELAKMNARREPLSADYLVSFLKEIVDVYENYTTTSPSDASVMEIGFGGRPFSAFGLQAFFGNVCAVDLDQPVFGIRQFPSALKTNGWLRAIKGTIRAEIFDRGEWKNFHKGMKVINPNYDESKTKLVVSNAASDDFWNENPGPYNLIYSTDVFEHIDKPSLQLVLKHMRKNLASDGVCVIRPMIFTGIKGGHDLPWYGDVEAKTDSTIAWQHLWNPDFTVDTYLNEVTRKEYVEMFEAAGFEILEDRALSPNLGKKHLTPEIKKKLDGKFGDYELFSNLVQFILIAK